MKKVLSYLSTVFATQLAREVALTTVVGAIILGVLWMRPAPKPIVTHPDAKTTVVTLPNTTITPKAVINYVQDDAEVKRLLAENKKLKQQVTQLTETIATHTSTGQGTVTTVPVSTEPEPLRPSPTPSQPVPASTALDFKDWRLHFVASGTQAKYELHQQFEVLSTTGRDTNGKPVAKTKLFEIGPGTTRTEITDIKTTAVFADATRVSWHAGITVQAGLGYAVDSGDTTKKGTAAVVGVQWLKRGRTSAAEDSTLSLLTPVASWTSDTVEFGVLPVSVNLGRIKHQPFKDLWASPYVGWNGSKRTVGHLGIVFTASF